jgi:glycosyltransferase involved in cell wall biosynthesis
LQHCCPSYSALFCSSVLNLSELCALRPDLAAIGKKIIYFHENQLSYPVQERKERDFQYGYNQILSALVADDVVFNSRYNMTSFLGGIDAFFALQPDHRPRKESLRKQIEPKSRVLYFPIKFEKERTPEREGKGGVLHVVWPHRWEHDKNPDAFFRCLFRLKSEGYKFRVTVLGESYSERPEIFKALYPDGFNITDSSFCLTTSSLNHYHAWQACVLCVHWRQSCDRL